MRDEAIENSAKPAHVAQRIPGDPLVWPLFAVDGLFFAAFFIYFATDRHKHEGLFAESQRALYQGLGLTSTLLLLSSSYAVVVGLQAVRAGGRHARRAFVVATACGAACAVVKVIEWSLLADYRGTNQFFIYYFSLTGLHFMQMLGGLLILTLLAVRAGRPVSREGPGMLFVSGCGFWHLIDLIWLWMYSLLYLTS